MSTVKKKSSSEEFYDIAALTQSIGVGCFTPDLEARAAIEQTLALRTLLGKLRFGKNAKFKLSAEGTVTGATALMTELYEAIKGDCFIPRALLWQGRFEPRVEAFWAGLKSHPVMQVMQPPPPPYYSRYPIPRPDPNPMIVEGLNHFIKQLESHYGTRKFKSRVTDHQAVYTRRAERIRSRLERLMENFPNSSWLAFSVWFPVLPGSGHLAREATMYEGCRTVKSAIENCLGRRNVISLLRPVYQRDEWIRVDVALASPNIFYGERQVLAQRIIAECDCIPLIWRPGMVQLEPIIEADSFRMYAHELGHWEATKRLAFYYGGADLAVSHGLLKDNQLFSLDMELLSLNRVGSLQPSRKAWPFSAQVSQQPYRGPNGWQG